MYCSFCREADHIEGQANYVIPGPTVYICDNCLSLGVGVLGDVIGEQRKVIRDLKQIIYQYEIGA